MVTFESWELGLEHVDLRGMMVCHSPPSSLTHLSLCPSFAGPFLAHVAMGKVKLLGPSEVRPGEGVPHPLGLHLRYPQHHLPEEEEAWRAPSCHTLSFSFRTPCGVPCEEAVWNLEIPFLNKA